jgi:orotidine-5'-phosphate decarboxylase
MSSPVILALDTKDLSQAESWIKTSSQFIDHYKVGLEFFLRNGVDGIRKLRTISEFELFLDLKLCDIPNTVKGAIESVAELKPKFLTVHASGGSKMITAAKDALPNGSITAVTVLTSFSEEGFAELGHAQDIEETTKSWARLALAAGATSLVCSPFEVATLRELSNSVTLITPGVRVPGDDLGDQVRVMSPKEAVSAGANFVVIGRSITQLWDGSGKAMQKKIELILNSLA